MPTLKSNARRQSRKSFSNRQHRFESLQPRQMMAADAIMSADSPQAEEIAPTQAAQVCHQSANAGQADQSSSTRAHQDVRIGPDFEAIAEQLNEQFIASFRTLFESEEAFHEIAQASFGDDYDVFAAEQFRRALQANDTSILPSVKFVDPMTLNEIPLQSDQPTGSQVTYNLGAYIEHKQLVLLSTDLISNPILMQQVHLEEIGHHLDATINQVDAAGDEGEMFRRLVLGESLDDSEIQEIQNEDDRGAIKSNNEIVETEYFSFRGTIRSIGNTFGRAASSAWNSTVNAFGSMGKGLYKAVYEGGRNALRGDFRAAFNDLKDGARMATFQAAGNLANGAVAAAKGIADAHAALLPGRAGDAARSVIDAASDATGTVFDGAIQIADTIASGTAETIRESVADVTRVIESAAKGNVKDALEQLAKTPLNLVVNELGQRFDLDAITTHMATDLLNAHLAPLFAQFGTARKLRSEEISHLEKVFGRDIKGGLNYDLIRIYEDNHLATHIGMLSHVVGNNIYFNQSIDMSKSHDVHLLTHEVAHVWQSQQAGNDYIHDAVAAQVLFKRLGSDAYDTVNDFLDGKSFREMNREQQAEIIADIGDVASQYTSFDDAVSPSNRLNLKEEFETALQIGLSNRLYEYPSITLTDQHVEQLIGIWRGLKTGEGLGEMGTLFPSFAIGSDQSRTMISAAAANGDHSASPQVLEFVAKALHFLGNRSQGELNFNAKTQTVTINGGELQDTLGVHYTHGTVEFSLATKTHDGTTNLNTLSVPLHQVRRIVFNGNDGHDRLHVTQGFIDLNSYWFLPKAQLQALMRAMPSVSHHQIRFFGGDGDDVMTNRSMVSSYARGGAGNDSLYGGSSRDSIFGDNGNDWLDGGIGSDWLYGGQGDDTLLGQSGNDRLYGSSGHDKIFGGTGNDYLSGFSGDDLLQGGSGNDRLYGGTGVDSLFGERGNDYLSGGDNDGSKDRLVGGAGADQYEYDRAFGKIYKNGRWVYDWYNRDTPEGFSTRQLDQVINRS